MASATVGQKATVFNSCFVEGIGPRTATRGAQAPTPAGGDEKTEKAVGSGKATLRLKAKGPPVVENIVVRNKGLSGQKSGTP